MPAASFDASQRKDFPKGETLVQQTVCFSSYRLPSFFLPRDTLIKQQNNDIQHHNTYLQRTLDGRQLLLHSFK